MLNKVLLNLTLGAIGLSLLWPVYAGAPAKVDEVAPVGELVQEAEAKIKMLEDYLATDKSFNESKVTSLPRDASVLAVLSQAISESSQASGWKSSAKDVRDGAIAVWQSKTYDDAKKGLEKIKAAHAGNAGDAKPEHDWNKLGKLGSLMKEVNVRKGKLTLQTRKNKTLTPQQSEEFARDASVLAVLGLAIHDDTHEVKSQSKEEIAEWQKYANDFRTEMTAAANALRKGDVKAGGDGVKKGNSACNECHGKFRPNE